MVITMLRIRKARKANSHGAAARGTAAYWLMQSRVGDVAKHALYETGLSKPVPNDTKRRGFDTPEPSAAEPNF